MGSSKNTGLKTAESPVSEALILICEKCGKKLARSEDPEENPSRKIQKYMKEEAKNRFGKGVIRTVVTTCMDVCPKEEIAIAISRTSPKNQTIEFFTLEDTKTETAAEAILEKLKRGTA